MELEILKIWPDWKATKLLGEGSFGKVYEIVRNNFGIEEHCALKVITIPSSPAELQSMRNEGMDDASATAYYKGLVEEFVQEIALMSKLKGNVNIVGYEDYAVIEHEDSIGWDIIIRMELLTALPAYIKDRSFTVNDVIKLAIDVCNALEVCHEQKIIHRDIKPDNIFVSQNGDYKLGDFGVARTIEKTLSGLSKKGTYTYMAPEVYKGEAYGTNVDLYSLGIVMYKLLNNNREPFLPPYPELIKYSDKNDALVKRMNGDIIPPPANCNEFLSRVILKSISFKSWERYQLPSQMKADLQSVKDSLGSGIAPILQADHIAASNTYSTGQSFNSAQYTNNSYVPNNSYTPNNSYVPNNSYRPNNSYVPSNPTTGGTVGNNVFVFGANNAIQQENTKTEKTNKTLKTVATVLGWIGAPLWFLMFIEIDTTMLIISLLVAVSMTLLTIKKLEPQRKIFSIIMLVLSIFTINIFNLIAAILYLCIKKTE